MAVIKRNGAWYTYFYPFKDKKIGLKLPDVQSKTEAKRIEAVILKACRSGIYEGLDADSREACIRMYHNQGWELNPELGNSRPTEELTLGRARELFLEDPEIKSSPGRWRYEISLKHLSEHFGEDCPLKSLWVPDLKLYQVGRQKEGAAPATVNGELSTFSRLFGVMVEHQLVDTNPVRLVKPLSTKSGERQVYVSFSDVQTIAETCPGWYQPIIWTAYYTGMRRGEILGLIRRQVNLTTRMIRLAPQDTKESNWKRVPIHHTLVPILEQVIKTPVLGSDKVFFLQDDKGIRPLGLETFKNPWERACTVLRKEERERKPETPKWEQPWPRFHDLRHTWKTNARRSGMHPEIEMAIMGHSTRGRNVHERYGRISDQELVQSIDAMTFNHGETEIHVAKGK